MGNSRQQERINSAIRTHLSVQKKEQHTFDSVTGSSVLCSVPLSVLNPSTSALSVDIPSHETKYLYTTLLCLTWITNKVLLNSTGSSAQCYVAAWMGGEFRGEWIHVNVWLSPFAVHLELSQHC